MRAWRTAACSSCPVVICGRTSRTTNRLVPVQKSRELGDYGPIERIWSPIDDGQIAIAEEQDELRTDVFIDGDPPEGYVQAFRYP